jgi:hypothetical protein
MKSILTLWIQVGECYFSFVIANMLKTKYKVIFNKYFKISSFSAGLARPPSGDLHQVLGQTCGHQRRQGPDLVELHPDPDGRSLPSGRCRTSRPSVVAELVPEHLRVVRLVRSIFIPQRFAVLPKSKHNVSRYRFNYWTSSLQKKSLFWNNFSIKYYHFISEQLCWNSAKCYFFIK